MRYAGSDPPDGTTRVTKYGSYGEVPFYRKQWFFWLLWVLPYVTIVAIALLVSGDIFYAKKGEVRSFGLANRIFAGVIGLLWIAGIVSVFAA